MDRKTSFEWNRKMWVIYGPHITDLIERVESLEKKRRLARARLLRKLPLKEEDKNEG